MKESTSDCQHAIVRIDGETSYRVIFNSVNAHKDTASEKGVGLDPEIVRFKRSLGMDIEATQDANRENGKTNNTTSGSVEKEEEEEFFTAFEEIFEGHRMSDIDGKDIVHLAEYAGPGFLTSTPKKDVSRHVDTIWYGPSIHILADILTFYFPRNLSGMPYDGDLGKKMAKGIQDSTSIPKETSSMCVETIW